MSHHTSQLPQVFATSSMLLNNNCQKQGFMLSTVVQSQTFDIFNIWKKSNIDIGNFEIDIYLKASIDILQQPRWNLKIIWFWKIRRCGSVD